MQLYPITISIPNYSYNKLSYRFPCGVYGQLQKRKIFSSVFKGDENFPGNKDSDPNEHNGR